MYIDKLDDIVSKYNNTYHRTTKKKPVGVILTLVKKLKLVILLEYQNIKIFLQKVTLQISQNKFLRLMEEKLLEPFTKKNCKKQIKKSSELIEVIKRKGNKLYAK